MARVRAELGLDALDPGNAPGARMASSSPLRWTRTTARPCRCRTRSGSACCAWHGVPPRLAEKLAAGKLEAALARVLRFGALALDGESPQPLLLAGPPGAGKTLTVARLATRLVMAGAQPLIITTDGRRAGATEQLAAFTRLLGLTLIVASHPATLARALMRRQPGAPVLIDAPGTDPFDPAQNDEIAGLAVTANAATALVCRRAGPGRVGRPRRRLRHGRRHPAGRHPAGPGTAARRPARGRRCRQAHPDGGRHRPGCRGRAGGPYPGPPGGPPVASGAHHPKASPAELQT